MLIISCVRVLRRAVDYIQATPEYQAWSLANEMINFKLKHSCRSLVVPKPDPLVSMVEPVSLKIKDIAVCVLLDSWVNTVKRLYVVRKYNDWCGFVWRTLLQDKSNRASHLVFRSIKEHTLLPLSEYLKVNGCRESDLTSFYILTRNIVMS